MKVLAMYLPQYYVTAQNDEWWGKGYTEWTAVKSAKPLFRGHIEPRVPLNNNYYDLSDPSAETWKWQAELAQKYSVYGFCIYHYWFEGKQLLETPMEILLNHPEINLNYCVCWANETWTRTWYGNATDVLMKQTYGDRKAWEEHFYYLNKFFKDPRYIKVNKKPMINIYHTAEIVDFEAMRSCWDELARDNGYDGVYIVSGNTGGKLEKRADLVDAYYNFEPIYSLNHRLSKFDRIQYLARTFAVTQINRLFHKKFIERKININQIYGAHKYESNKEKTIFPGSVPMWDNSPRRGYKGLVYTKCSPEMFEKHLELVSRQINEEPYDFVYINAWNEWGEGAYLEPDEDNKFRYLEVISEVVSQNERK